MRKLLLFLVFISSVNNAKTQEIPTPLIDRVNSVNYIFEGLVLESTPYYTDNGGYIRTSNLVQITKILKGELECGTIEIITNGGEVNDERLEISHSLDLYPNAMGIFLCNETNRPLSPIDFYAETNLEVLEGQFENQSFIRYWWNGQEINAADVWHNYDSLSQVYNFTELITGLQFIECEKNLFDFENAPTSIVVKKELFHEEKLPLYSKEDFNELISYAKYKKDNYTRIKSSESTDEIYYSLSNLSISGSNQKFLEFDVNVRDNLGTKYLDQSAIRLEYDASAFGTNIVANGNIVVTRGSLNADTNCYSSPIPSDANPNTILIPALETVFSQCKAPILQTNQSIMHIKMKIQTCNLPNVVALIDTATFFGPSLIINYCAYADFPADTFQTYYQQLEHSQIDSVPNCIKFWPKSLSGGTNDTLTVVGNSFGSNKGHALFPDADNGGISKVLIENNDILYWSDSLIKFIIPSYGNTNSVPAIVDRPVGSGKFELYSSLNDTLLIDSLHVLFSVLNHPDKMPYVIAPFNYMNKKFVFRCDTAVANYGGGKMKQVLNKALLDWKCMTGIDWELGADTVFSPSFPLVDSVCTVSFFDYPDTSNILAVTQTYSVRQPGPPDTSYQTFETDVIINSDIIWFSDTIATNTVPLGEDDFYSTILHELGHAHGLKHVIDTNAIMYYSEVSHRVIDLQNDNSCDYGGNWMAKYTNNLNNPVETFFFSRMVFDSIKPCSSVLSIFENVEIENINLSLYPNPCTNEIGVNIANYKNKTLIISVFDITGQEVLQAKEILNNGKIDVNNLPNGTYILRIYDENSGFISASKFLKQ